MSVPDFKSATWKIHRCNAVYCVFEMQMFAIYLVVIGLSVNKASTDPGGWITFKWPILLHNVNHEKVSAYKAFGRRLMHPLTFGMLAAATCGPSPTCKPCRIDSKAAPQVFDQPSSQFHWNFHLPEINPQGSPQLLLRKAISSKCVLNCSTKIAIPQMEVHQFHFQPAQPKCLPHFIFLIESKSSCANMNPD